MVPSTGTRLPFSRISVSEKEFAAQIGDALRKELGGSRRATKTVMQWTGVSDHTARAWLHGASAPSGLHLIMLAANSGTVMINLLRLTGHPDLELGMQIQEVRVQLEATLELVYAMEATS